ncbi:divergent serine/threonine protein kinase [Marseillevirus Shanghai 1]|nr:divergent serine/threonine protein kinase [Marseillevirus Shanghai 1]
MCSIIKVEVEGETLYFQGEDDIDAQRKLDLWIEQEVFSFSP